MITDQEMTEEEQARMRALFAVLQKATTGEQYDVVLAALVNVVSATILQGVQEQALTCHGAAVECFAIDVADCIRDNLEVGTGEPIRIN